MQAMKEVLIYIFLMQLFSMFNESICPRPQSTRNDLPGGDSDLVQIVQKDGFLTVELDETKLKAACQDAKLSFLSKDTKTSSYHPKQQESLKTLHQFFGEVPKMWVGTDHVSHFFKNEKFNQVLRFAESIDAGKLMQELRENKIEISKVTEEIITEVKTLITTEEEKKITKIKNQPIQSLTQKKTVKYQVNSLIQKRTCFDLTKSIKGGPNLRKKENVKTLLEVVDAYDTLTTVYIQEEVEKTVQSECSSSSNTHGRSTPSYPVSDTSFSKLPYVSKPTFVNPPIISKRIKNEKTGYFSFTIDISTGKDSKVIGCPHFSNLPLLLRSNMKKYLDNLEREVPYRKERDFNPELNYLHSRVSYFFKAEYFKFINEKMSFLGTNVLNEITQWEISAAWGFSKILNEIETYMKLTSEKRFEETILRSVLHDEIKLVWREEEKVHISYRPFLNLKFLESAENEIKGLTEPQKRILRQLADHVRSVQNMVETYIQFSFIQTWESYCKEQQPRYLDRNNDALRTIKLTLPIMDNGKQIDCRHPMLPKNMEKIKERSQGAASQLAVEAQGLNYDKLQLLIAISNDFSANYGVVFDRGMVLELVNQIYKKMKPNGEGFEKMGFQTMSAAKQLGWLNDIEIEELPQAFEAHIRNTKNQDIRVRGYLTQLIASSKIRTLDQREGFRIEGCYTKTEVDSNGGNYLNIAVNYKPVYDQNAFTKAISRELKRLHDKYLIWYDVLLRGAIEYQFYEQAMALCKP